jgi:putative FmdB family regulatory protein
MPVYEYECAGCGVFPQFRSIADRDDESLCMVCDQPLQRLISAPNLALMSPIQRMAATRNEQSRHAPRVGVKNSCCSGGPCKHKGKSPTTKDGRPALRGSKKKNRRPWMLGH